tara:strand:- start:30033 stop:31886 length:1854 start_codon:yes stop_codon:yes gene_type:complete
MNYRKDIDGLRALAVIPVILFHAGFNFFRGGYIGVDVFFVISGYLITSIILKELKDNTFSIINFYERRARRILPALFFVMLICIPFSYFLLLPNELIQFGNSLISVSLFGSNFLFWQESGYFDVASELKPLLHTWSLAVEEQYYIFFPIFFIMVWKYLNKFISTSFFIVLILSFFLMIVGNYYKPGNMFFFYMLPTRAWEIMTGSLIAIYLDKKVSSSNKIMSNFLSLIGLLFILISIIIFDENTPFPSLYTILPVVGTSLIILFSSDKSITFKFLGSKIMVGIGLISYSAYLWHQPLLAFAKYRLHDSISSFLIGFICLISFVLAYISWKYIESPFRNRNRFKRNKIFKLTFFFMIFFIFSGYHLKKDRGLISRFDLDESRVLESFIDSKNYVVKNFGAHKLQNFDNDDLTKNIFIIGDSFSEDLVNAIYEVDLNKRYSISTYYVPTKCGNVYLKERNILELNSRECPDILSNAKIVSIIKNADEIWLASSWKEWAIPYIQLSIDNLFQINNTKIRIFGRKDFGTVESSQYFYTNSVDKIIGERSLSKNHTQIAIKMANEKYTNAEYIDVSILLCGSYSKCINSTSDGFPISYDGGHLTKAGALYFGKILKTKLVE